MLISLATETVAPNSGFITGSKISKRADETACRITAKNQSSRKISFLVMKKGTVMSSIDEWLARKME